MKLTAIPRMTLGLVALAVGLLLTFDVLLNLFPREADTQEQLHARVANNLAIQTAALVQARDWRTVNRTLAVMQSRDPEIVSIGLRRADGALVSQAGPHLARWAGRPGQASSSDELSVGILSEGQRWGALEIGFRPLAERGFVASLLAGPGKLMLLFSVAASLLFYVYLRRALHYLDPAGAVPERVRGAFDALTEGVLIVDPREQVLLVNQSFAALGPEDERVTLVGRSASSLRWLQPVSGDEDAPPWMRAMRTRQQVRAQPYRIAVDGRDSGRVVVNCSPLLDDSGQGVRGCLVTIDDVTALERSHEQMLDVLADLAISKEQLELKNTELEDLASRDPLSGCLNRRALFAGLQRLFRDRARYGDRMICILADIDHFKQVNDNHGHAVGDEAIKRFAAILQSCVRQGDLVARYGGEEFCVVVAGVDIGRGIALAEAMRKQVSAERGIIGSAGTPVPITASFGVTSLSFGAADGPALVEEADRAMYLAKQGGRNRVVAAGQVENKTPITEELL